MKVKRICKNCGHEFIATKVKQWHCSKRCFKHTYFQEVQSKNYGFPKFKCPDCDRLIDIKIDPTKDEFFWTNYKCPYCNPSERRRVIVIKTTKKIYVLF